MTRAGLTPIGEKKNGEKEPYHVVYGARLRVKDGEHVTHGQILAEWDPFTFSILTETAGSVKFDDLRPGLTIEEQVDEVTGDRKSTRLNSSHGYISYAVFCLKKKRAYTAID